MIMSLSLEIASKFSIREVRKVGPDASWRTQPLLWEELIGKITDTQESINPLLFAPWVNQSCFRKDWLHVADLGMQGQLN